MKVNLYFFGFLAFIIDLWIIEFLVLVLYLYNVSCYSLMEALQSGSAFSRERPRKKANPRVAGGKVLYFVEFIYFILSQYFNIIHEVIHELMLKLFIKAW